MWPLKGLASAIPKGFIWGTSGETGRTFVDLKKNRPVKQKLKVAAAAAASASINK